MTEASKRVLREARGVAVWHQEWQTWNSLDNNNVPAASSVPKVGIDWASPAPSKTRHKRRMIRLRTCVRYAGAGYADATAEKD